MKQKWILKFFSLTLAGVLFATVPAQAMAADLKETGLEMSDMSEIVSEAEEPEIGTALPEIEVTEEKVEISSEPEMSGEEVEISSEVEKPEEMEASIEEKSGENELPSEEAPEEQQPIDIIDSAVEDGSSEELEFLENTEITSVSLEPASGTVAVGETISLTATAYSESEKVDSSFSWVSSDAQIATIDVDGIVTGIKPGNVTITVGAGGKKATCDVTVIIPISSVALDKSSISLKRNQTITLLVTIKPDDTTESKIVSWESSDTGIVSVDSTGNLKGIKAGTADITVKTENDLTAVCHVTVLDEEYRTGWQWINGKWYYFDLNGEKTTGWQYVNGYHYYMDDNGVMKTGWQWIDGKWYYFNTSGERRSGWLTLDNKTYYLTENGIMQTGWGCISNKWYYFNQSGEMQCGWIYVSNKRYYLDQSGIMQTGWLEQGSQWYFLNSDGSMRTGWVYLSNKWYYLSQSGVMSTGWLNISNKWYYLNTNGMMQTGWKYISNKWYYFNADGVMQTGLANVGSYIYYFDTNGAMQTGWQYVSGKWYYIDSNTGAQLGWKKIGSAWYYFSTNGQMQTGWLFQGNEWYYLNSSGIMQTGWIEVSGKRYYLNQDGVMQTGWRQIGLNWYYFNSDGSMKTGWFQAGSVWFYLKSTGVMATSDIVIDGKINQFDSNGVWKGVLETGQIRAYGIDVSSNQGSIDWDKVADDDIDFAMLRVVVGKGSKMERDSRFKEYYDGARSAGIKVGAYRYSYATSRTTARAEADAVINALNGRKLDYPVVLDVEDESILSGTDSNHYRSEIILAFKKEIEDAGYEFALYANTTWLNNYLDMSMLEDVDIWVARWRALDRGHGYTGAGNVVMWQYSSSGKVDGISGNVDLNVSYKRY